MLAGLGDKKCVCLLIGRSTVCRYHLGIHGILSEQSVHWQIVYKQCSSADVSLLILRKRMNHTYIPKP